MYVPDPFHLFYLLYLLYVSDFLGLDQTWAQFFWNLGIPGLVATAVCFWLTYTTIYRLRKGCTWEQIFQHFAIASVVPAMGLYGMLWLNYEFLVFMGDSPQPAETVVQWTSRWCDLGVFANDCQLYSFSLGILLIFKKIGLVPMIKELLLQMK